MKIAFLVIVDICKEFDIQTLSNSAAYFWFGFLCLGVWDNVPMITLLQTSVMTVGCLSLPSTAGSCLAWFLALKERDFYISPSSESSVSYTGQLSGSHFYRESEGKALLWLLVDSVPLAVDSGS